MLRCWRCRYRAAADGYTFDPALLRGSVLSNSALSQFNQQDAVAPGSYQIDLYLNGQFLERDQIRFVRAGKQVLPLFRSAAADALRAEKSAGGRRSRMPAARSESQGHCGERGHFAAAADLSIPQALLNGQPRGSVNPASPTAEKRWPRQLQPQPVPRQLPTGANPRSRLDLRQPERRVQPRAMALPPPAVQLPLRSRARPAATDTSRRYVQRAILPGAAKCCWAKALPTGTSSGLGLSRHSAQFGRPHAAGFAARYAPVVRGVAKSNARVTVLQGKSTLYETTVAPGPFAINDLYATNYAGDPPWW